MQCEESDICCYATDRRSRRARKDRQPVKVSSTDTLAQLRLKVFDALYIHPKNQKLYARGAQIQGDQQTLAQVSHVLGHCWCRSTGGDTCIRGKSPSLFTLV